MMRSFFIQILSIDIIFNQLLNAGLIGNDVLFIEWVIALVYETLLIPRIYLFLNPFMRKLLELAFHWIHIQSLLIPDACNFAGVNECRLLVFLRLNLWSQWPIWRGNILIFWLFFFEVWIFYQLHCSGDEERLVLLSRLTHQNLICIRHFIICTCWDLFVGVLQNGLLGKIVVCIVSDDHFLSYWYALLSFIPTFHLRRSILSLLFVY